MNKFDTLNALIEQLGLSQEEIAKVWYENRKLSRDFLERLLSGKEPPLSEETLKTSQKISAGMFYYAEVHLFSKKILGNKQVSGVVAYVDDNQHGLIVTLNQEKLPWSSQRDQFGLPAKMKGSENSAFIVAALQDSNKKAEAVEYCATYEQNGIQKGQAFLPSLDELKLIEANFDRINKALLKICGADLLEESSYYWSSSECKKYPEQAWVFRFAFRETNRNHKDYGKNGFSGFYARPCISITF